MIKRVSIRNYRIFRQLDFELNDGINTVVGGNASGKSTLIEAITLAMTGKLNGRAFAQSLNPYIINNVATAEFIGSIDKTKQRYGKHPEVIVELYFDENENTAKLKGRNNLANLDACGVRMQAVFSHEFTQEFKDYVLSCDKLKLIPTEYYKIEWLAFSGNAITHRSLPASASVIDPALNQFQGNIDQHLQQIITSNLAIKDRIELARQYRSLREGFNNDKAVTKINERLKNNGSGVTDKLLSLSIDLSNRYSWESSVTAHLDDLPFQLIGKGEQNSVKVVLALGHDEEKSRIVLIEEPETHLSFTSLRKLLSKIENKCHDKQVIIATHNNFVMNKLGMHSLFLLGGQGLIRIMDLPAGTIDYFKKLPGHDTLRLLLADKVILVEGPSDELIVQRAYNNIYKKLPIDDGIDVICVGTSHKRFLDLAIRLKRNAKAIIDNDGREAAYHQLRFKEYLKHDHISLFVSDDIRLRTLEYHIVNANQLEVLNALFDKDCSSPNEMLTYMLSEKTHCALRIFESTLPIKLPEYIQNACR